MQASTSAAAAQRGHINRTSQSQSAAEQSLLQNDARYKKYAIAVEKCLLSFDQVAEWADFITFLAKLLKTLQTYPHFTQIPHRLTVAKRLAQCLNPALPTGVHQRALDVYVHILNTIGPTQLVKDLSTWSTGLFPFFQYAATSVRPIVLGIYSKFYLPLQESLRPCMKAFILALLPGVEEETSEFFDKVSSLLDQLSGTVNQSFFFQNIWLILLTCPFARIPALNYLSKRLPTISIDDTLSPIIGNDLGLMVRGLAASLEDGRILIQRAVLDLLTAVIHLNGKGFQKELRKPDQTILMKSCLTVVLKRDLSLSRRLYSWLLGSQEATSATQIAFLKDFGLKLLVETLKSEMLGAIALKDTLERQRPFKIFVSLLDKWEIGSLLTEHMVIDVFRALEKMLDPSDLHDDLHMTANMLFESLDPYLTWQALYNAVMSDLEQADLLLENVELVTFLVHNFRLDENEVLKLHAPLLAYAILESVEAGLCSRRTDADLSKLLQAVHLAQDLLREISPDFYAADVSQRDLDSVGQGFARAVTNSFYSASSISNVQLPDATLGNLLRMGGLATQFRTTEAVASSSLPLSDAAYTLLSTSMDCLCQILPTKGVSILTGWDADSWLYTVLSALKMPTFTSSAFSALTASISAFFEISQANISPSLRLDRASTFQSLVDLLLLYLDPQLASCHSECVRLIWLLQSITEHNYVESIISSRMSSYDPVVKQAAYEAFGVLWRLSEDDDLPSSNLAHPLFLVLNATKSEDVLERTLAESWMRCSFKSYARLTDPILAILINAATNPRDVSTKALGQLWSFKIYERPLDQAQLLYALSTLLNLLTTRGAGFHRTLKSSIYKSGSEYLEDKVVKTPTYLDLICLTVADLLLTDLQHDMSSKEADSQHLIHLACIDIVHIIIQRGEVDDVIMGQVEYGILARLAKAVDGDAIEMQNKSLHTLHAILQAKQSTQRRRQSASRASIETAIGKSDRATASSDDLLCAVLIDGMIRQRDSASLHYWVDFFFMSLSHLKSKLDSLIFPLINNVISRMDIMLHDFDQTYDPSHKGKGVLRSRLSEVDFLALAGALERLLLVALEDVKGTNEASQATKLGEKNSINSETSGGFLTYVTGAFSASDSASVPEDAITTKSQIVTEIEKALSVYLKAWILSSSVAPQEGETPSDLSQSFLSSRISTRTRKCLERLYKTIPAEVIENIIMYWHEIKDSKDANRTDGAKHVLTILDLLAPSAQKVVSTCLDAITIRARAFPVSSLANPDLLDTWIFDFMEQYVKRLEGPIAIQIWSPLLTFARDALNSTSASSKYHLLPVLRIYTIVGAKIAQTSALEDRKLRKDLQDTFMKLLDGTLAHGGRTGQGLRKVESNSSLANSVLADGEKLPVNGDLVIDSPTPNGQPTVAQHTVPTTSAFKELAEFLADFVLPNLKRFLFDNDKIATICGSVMQTCLAPSFNKRTKSFDVDTVIFHLLEALTQQTNPTTVRIWRGPVSDWFSDLRFFNSSTDVAARWKPIVASLISVDKDRFTDLIARVSTSASSAANIFTNKELENLNRALSLRRLAYVLFISEKDGWLTMLPAIQEKLVEVLRANVGDMVHAEVYLCFRVLLCRISEQHLNSLWPIILTEMLRLFETLYDKPSSSSSPADYLQLILAACKFLDLLLVLQTEDFQIHEWIFVTDTTDALYAPENFENTAIMDRVADTLHGVATPGVHPIIDTQAKLRKPLLSHLRQNDKLDSIAALEPFFQLVSTHAFDSIYAKRSIDWAQINLDIEKDMFEG